MKRLLFICKSKGILDIEQHNNIIYEIEVVNLIRMKILLKILLVIQILFIIFSDINYYIAPNKGIMWECSGYLVVHVLLLSTSVIGLIIIKILKKTDTGKWKRVYRYFTPCILVIFLILISLLNGLDQLNTKNISNLFIANLLICGGIFMLNFPKNLFTYAIPYLFYIRTYLFLGFKKDIVFMNLINDFIFLLAIIIVSTSIYNYQYEAITKNILLEKTNKQLNYISNHDPLTGLLNRRGFNNQKKNKPDGKMESATIVLVDIDFFKSVNDRYGHPVGDLVLKKVSSILVKNMKEEDLVVRWGGEEFLLLLVNTSMENAYDLTDILRKSIEELTIQVKENKIQVTASFGIASYKNEGDNPFYTAYKAADKALYQAKKQGRNRVVKSQ